MLSGECPPAGGDIFGFRKKGQQCLEIRQFGVSLHGRKVETIHVFRTGGDRPEFDGNLRGHKKLIALAEQADDRVFGGRSQLALNVRHPDQYVGIYQPPHRPSSPYMFSRRRASAGIGRPFRFSARVTIRWRAASFSCTFSRAGCFVGVSTEGCASKINASFTAKLTGSSGTITCPSKWARKEPVAALTTESYRGSCLAAILNATQGTEAPSSCLC